MMIPIPRGGSTKSTTQAAYALAPEIAMAPRSRGSRSNSQRTPHAPAVTSRAKTTSQARLPMRSGRQPPPGHCRRSSAEGGMTDSSQYVMATAAMAPTIVPRSAVKNRFMRAILSDSRAALLAFALVACGRQTCVIERIHYAGRADGDVYLHVRYTDPQGKLVIDSIGGHYGSVAAATATPPPSAVGGGTCWKGSSAESLTADATAWIDVQGHYPLGCSDTGCAPQAGDPAGHTTQAIRDFEQNYVDIEIGDP